MNETIFLNIVTIFSLVIAFIGWHAFVDANQKKLEAEERFNDLPRIKPVRRKLKWTGRLLSFISLQSFR